MHEEAFPNKHCTHVTYKPGTVGKILQTTLEAGEGGMCV